MACYNAARLQLIRPLVPGQDNEKRARNVEGSAHCSYWKRVNDRITWLHTHNNPFKTLLLNEKFLLVFKTGNNVHVLNGTHELECLIMSPAADAKKSFSISAAFLSDSFHCYILINCLASTVKGIKKKK